MNRRSLRRLGWLWVAFVLTVVVFMPAVSAQAAPQPPSRFDVKFSGVITSIPTAPNYPVGAWIVAGQTVTVTVGTRILPNSPAAVAGMWADVTAKRQGDGALVASQVTIMPAEVRIKGPIAAKPAASTGIGNWTIAGLVIQATADTKISQRGAPLNVGNWAEVFATETAAGLVAVRMRGLEPQTDIEIFGAIETFSATNWTLSGIEIAVNDDTLILGAPATGLLAQAAASLQSDNSLLALRLRVAALDPGSQRQPVEFDGIVEALPDRGLEGQWTVSGQKVVVSPATLIRQEKGLVVVGAQVHVVGWQGEDKVNALQIIVLSSPASAGEFVRFAGPIEALPASRDLIGVWQVAGRSVNVTRATRIAGAPQAKVGAVAAVAGILGAEGVITATEIKIMSRPGPH